MDDGGVERAVGEMHFANEPVARVHEDGIKMFDLIGAAFFPQEPGDRFGCVEFERGIVDFRCHSTGEREGALQRDRFVAADTLDGLQLLQRGLGQCAQRSELLNQFRAHVHGRFPLKAGAQKDGDEFGIGKRIGAQLGQAFARAFTVWQILYAR